MIDKQIITDFKTAFIDCEAGRRVIEYLSKYCFESRSTIDNDSARNSDFNQGRREVILEIRRKLNVNLNDIKNDLEKEQL
jgi:hypothetical protein